MFSLGIIESDVQTLQLSNKQFMEIFWRMKKGVFPLI